MFRYLAFLWDSRNACASAYVRDIESRLITASSSWHLAFAGDTIRVLCAPANTFCPQIISRPHGVVLGSIFHAPRIDDPEATALTPTASVIDAWLDDDARLTKDSWGNYVAFHCVPQTRRIRIHKDPTGALPCLHIVRGAVHLFFSCLSDVRDLNLSTLKINRDYLHRRLLSGEHPARCDALIGVTPLIGGERVELDFDTTPATLERRQSWHPGHFCEHERMLASSVAARRALRATALACTWAWAQRHRHIVHRLSGGLDSSIVLGCLVRSGARHLTNYTYFDAQGRCDERRWARAAAEHAGSACLEYPFSSDDVRLPQIVTFRPTLEPVSTLTYLQRASLERRLCAEFDAGAVFTGQGGDAGFCRDSIGLMVPEYLQRRGFRLQAVSLSAAVARHTDLSFWQVLSAGLRHHWFGSHPRDLAGAHAQMSQLAHPQLRHTTPPAGERHPWLDGSRFLPSLHRRLGSLLQPSEFYDVSIAPGEDAPAVISPLLSQPVVEVCLRIPAHVHFYRGIERGLARSAFEQEVPASILQRCWKDRAPGFMDRVLAAHRPFVRDLLLDGVLVREQLLSRRAVEAALRSQTSRSQVSAIEILNHVDTEVWLRQWQ